MRDSAGTKRVSMSHSSSASTTSILGSTDGIVCTKVSKSRPVITKAVVGSRVATLAGRQWQLRVPLSVKVLPFSGTNRQV